MSSYAFSIENLRRQPKNPDMWIFSIRWPALGVEEGLLSHAWKYYESSDQVRKPTAKHFPGALTSVDRQAIEEIRRQVQIRIAHYNIPTPARMVYQRLMEFRADKPSWGEVYTHVFETFDKQDQILTPGQWALFMTASILASITTEEAMAHIDRLSAGKKAGEVEIPAEPEETEKED